jgi:hypothetical protein
MCEKCKPKYIPTKCTECGQMKDSALMAKACALRDRANYPDPGQLINRKGHDGPHGPRL